MNEEVEEKEREHGAEANEEAGYGVDEQQVKIMATATSISY